MDSKNLGMKEPPKGKDGKPLPPPSGTAKTATKTTKL